MLLGVFLCAVVLSVGMCAPPFQVSLSTLPSYRLGQEVICEVTITNTFHEDLFLYTRNSPLRAIKSDVFTVSLAGTKLHYDGILLKKAPADSDSERVLVPAGRYVSAKVDLSLVYPLSVSGVYTLGIATGVSYASQGGSIAKQLLSSPPMSFKIVPGDALFPRLTLGEKLRRQQSPNNLFKHKVNNNTNNNTLKNPIFAGTGGDVDKKTATEVWSATYKAVVASSTAVSKQDDHYVKWFGAKDEGRLDVVMGAFLDIKLSMETHQYTLYFKGQECERNEFASTFAGSVYIYLCDGYFRAQDTHDYNSKLGTFVHALAIATADVEDVSRIYTPEECQNLALDVPLRAVRNAFNYEYYAETSS